MALEPMLSFKYNLSICAILKNEGEYLAEWIEFHRIVGVEKFYIYDNESSDNTKDVLAPYIKSGIVEYTYWPGWGQQGAAYNDCIAKHKFDTKWLAIIDLDEFIVPVATKTVPELLDNLGDLAGLEIKWTTYGSSGHKTKTEGLVIERFKYHAAADFARDALVKSIVNPRLIVDVGAHRHVYLSGRVVNGYGHKVGGAFKNNLLVRLGIIKHKEEKAYDAIRINHYAVKSWEEYVARRTRGDNDAINGAKYNKEYFDLCNRNEVHDLIMDKYIEQIKKRLGV